MAAVFPGTVATIASNKSDDIDSKSGADLGLSATTGDHAAHHNQIAEELVATQTELGTDPSGTFATVKARLDSRLTVRKSADQNMTTSTLANVTDLSFAVASGQDYMFKFYIPFTSGTTVTTGFALGVTCPALTGYIVYGVSIFAFGADGAASNWFGIGTSSGDKVMSTAQIAASALTYATVEGIMSNASASGTLQLQAATEIAATTVVRRGAYGEMYLN